MSNLIVLPMIIPVLTGIILVFLRPYLKLQRLFSVLSIILTGALSVYLLQQIQTQGILSLEFGDWEAPYGIVFVADSFAMLLVLTTSFITLICLLYAFSTIGEAYERMFFYSFVQFLVAGVNGSFLTGDLFNLFVCFEVMLIASYILVMLGGKKVRLQESIKYIAINVLSSWFFLIGIAYLYGTMGTINLADLADKVSDSGQTPLLTTISILYLIVFALKSGLLLFFWLPGSYSVPPTAVAALFGALLTKVGVYAMFRIFSLIFYHEPSITHTLIGVMAAVSLIIGSIGAIAYKDLRQVAAFNVIIAIGFIMVGLAISTPVAIEGSIYYLIHDMIVKAMLYLLIGTMILLTGKTRINQMSGLIRNYPTLGWLFFIVTLSLAGIPPFSGFIGKVLVGQGTVETGAYLLLALAFISSIFVLYSLLRVFMNCFWGETIITIEDEKPMKISWLLPSAILAIATFALGLGAESISAYVSDAADTLMNPEIYIQAVLPEK
ncbi:MAG TPA: Na+/H+ antiporter subunit D [Candidatus Avamphibacillus sp.]|nr:Na+/H+ antiporter subunit D [Candidatus Avamphibacillus sp.]